ncbi:hypothetical protein FCV25MIE_00203 [Fagus crenata]
METPQPCEIYGFCGISASAISRRYLIVIVRKDLNQWIQQIGTHMIIQEGVREEILYYNVQVEKSTSSSQCPTFAYRWHQHIQQYSSVEVDMSDEIAICLIPYA